MEIIIHIIPSILISFVLQLILHEIGHFIGGFITGWRFLYIQIHKLVLLKESNKLKLMIVKDKGYKCIMYPISLNTGGLIYTMGGCVINLLSGIACLVIIITVSMSPLMWLYIWCFGVFGIGLYLMNGISSIKRVCNDKTCYNLLKEDERTRLCHNGQLLMAKELANGYTYKEIRKDIICLCKDIAENDIQAYQAILEYYYYLDKNDFIKMRNAINKVSRKENLSKETIDMVEMELNYVLLLSEIKLLLGFHHDNISCNKAYDKSYDKSYDKPKVNHSNIISENNLSLGNLKQSITEHKKDGDVHSLRIIIAYEAYSYLVVGDMDRAGEIINNGIKLLEETNAVYLGEKNFCIDELKKMKSMIESIVRVDIADKACVI